MSYAPLATFGSCASTSPSNNPLTYCMTSELDNNFNHTIGQRAGPYSGKCQQFMSDYCAQKWDGICEVASRNTNTQLPNTVKSSLCNVSGQGACLGPGFGNQFTMGDILIRNTAAKKYLMAMSAQCGIKKEPFDPLVPNSPMITYWDPTNCDGCYSRGTCIQLYEVNPATIDNDVVMNKILSKPLIAMDILINIYNTAKAFGKFDKLKGTKLYAFFMSNYFQNIIKQKRAVKSGKTPIGSCCGP